MELFRLLGVIAIDNTEANNAIDETARRASNAEKKTGGSFQAIGSAAVSAGKWIAGAGAAIGGSVLAITEGTREYRKEMGLLESSFLTAGHSSETAKKTYSELNAVLGDSGQAVEASQHLAKITDDEKELETWTNICTGVFSEFGQAIPLESLTESALEVQKNGQLTGGLVDALVWAGINEEEFQAKLDACTTEQERQDLIMNTLNDTYKGAAEQYKKTNKDVMEAEKAQEKLSDAFAELGRVFEPIVTSIKEKIAEMVSAAAPKIQELIDKIKDGITWIKENENTIQAWVGVILGATVAIGTFLLILNWGTIMTAAASAIGKVRTAILLMNAAMLANPVGIVIAVLAGLVAAFIYLWNTCEPFKQFWLDLWDSVKESTGKAVDWISEKFDQIVSFFKDNWQGILLFIVNPFAGAFKLLYDNFEGFRNFVDNFVEKISKFFSDLLTKIKSSWSGTKTWFSNLFSDTLSGIKNVFGGIVSWISGIATNVKTKFSDGISGIKGKASEIFGAVKETIKEKIESAKEIVDKAIKKIKGFFDISLKFKAVKMPEISVKWGKSPAILAKAAELLNIPGVPQFSVKWNAQGGILDNPAIFGFDPKTRQFLGGGEAGAEALAPIDVLLSYVREAVRSENEPVLYYMRKIVAMMAEYMPQMAQNEPQILLDGDVLVGRLAPSIDKQLGILANRKIRGNT